MYLEEKNSYIYMPPAARKAFESSGKKPQDLSRFHEITQKSISEFIDKQEDNDNAAGPPSYSNILKLGEINETTQLSGTFVNDSEISGMLRGEMNKSINTQE